MNENYNDQQNEAWEEIRCQEEYKELNKINLDFLKDTSDINNNTIKL
jgi:hypothetical protein